MAPGKKPVVISPEDVEDAERDFVMIRSLFLQQQGWRNTSQVFGNLWMWTKEIDGKHTMMDVETARLVAEEKYHLGHPDE
jgi:hypothetical protein